MTEDEAVEKLAEVLRWKLEHLDPTEDGDVAWKSLTEHHRDLYRTVIRRLACENEAWAVAMAVLNPPPSARVSAAPQPHRPPRAPAT